ncbi:MAG: YbbR-like domain-containing protein [Bacteroidia bacterium]
MQGKSLSAIKKKYPSHRLFSFFICLLISIFLWLINALNRNYTRTVAIPVNFVNYPVGKRFVNKLPPYIMADIKTTGAKLVMLLIKKSIAEITIDVSKITSIKSTSGSASISTATSIGNLSKLLNVEVDLLKVKPDSIRFIFGKTFTKKIFIKPIVQINYAIPQGIFKHIKVIPPYITVSSDSLTLAKTDTFYTEKIILNSLNQRVEQQTGIDVPEALEGLVSLSDTKVTLQINLDEYAQKTIQIPVQVLNAPPNTNVKTFPTFVNVTITAPYNLFDSLNTTTIKAFVDFKQTDMHTEKLTISVTSTILNNKITQISPQRVDYIIRKP